MKSVERLVASINNLPTLPTVFATLSEAIESPSVTNEKLAQIISADQASSFKILKIANSAFYGFRGKVETISQAILYLGFNEVRNIVFALSVMNYFSKNKRLPNFSPVDLWTHSIAVGIVNRLIGKGIGVKNVENFFLAGVLHDIGRIILLEYSYVEFEKVLRLVESKNYSLIEAEEEVYGMNHSRVGFLLAEKWKLPPAIQDTILYHHSGITGGDNKILVASVHISNIVARMLDLGHYSDDHYPEPNQKAWDLLNIPDGYFTTVLEQVIEMYHQTIRVMLAD